MEKSQKEYEAFMDVVRAELLRRLDAGELSEDDISVLKKEDLFDEPLDKNSKN